METVLEKMIPLGGDLMAFSAFRQSIQYTTQQLVVLIAFLRRPVKGDVNEYELLVAEKAILLPLHKHVYEYQYGCDTACWP